MSNTRHTREFQKGSGRLTRPAAQWKGKARGSSRSPLGAEMNRVFTSMFQSMIGRNAASLAGTGRNWQIPRVTLPMRKGADRG